MGLNLALPHPHSESCHNPCWQSEEIQDNRIEDSERIDLQDVHGPRRCLVGNIKRAKSSNPDWKGSKKFSKGQKIYFIAGDGDRLVVVGKRRHNYEFITAWLSTRHAENWRIQSVYKRVVLMNTCDCLFKGATLEAIRDSLNAEERYIW